MRIRHSHSDEHSSPFPSSLVPFTIPVLISVILVILTSTTCLGPMLATTAPIPMPLPQPQSMLILPATESRSHSSRPGGNPNTNGQLVRVRLQSTEDTRLMRRIANDFGADIWSSREILLNRTNFQPVNPPRRPRRRRRLPTRLNAPWVRPSNRPTRPTGGGVRPGSDRPLPASRPNLIRRSYQSARQPYPPPTRDERQDVQKSITPAASPQPIEIPSSVPPPLARIYQQQGLTFGGEVDLLVRGDILDRLQAMFPQVEFHTIIRNVSKAIEETHRDVPWKLPVAEPAKTPCVDVTEVAAPDRVGDGEGGSGTGVGCKCGRGCRSASTCTVSDGAPAATRTGNVSGGGEADGGEPPIATSGGGNGPTITDEGSPPPTQTVDASSSLTVPMATATSTVSTAAQTDGPAPTPSNRTNDDDFFATRPTATPTNGDSVVDDDGFVDWTDPIIRPNDPITPDDVDSPPRLFPPGSGTSSLPSDGLRPTISQVGSTTSKSATPIMSTTRSAGPTSASATYTGSAAGSGTLPPTPTGSSTGSLTAIGSSSTQTGTSIGSPSPGGSATTKTGSIGASSSSTGSFPSSMPRGDQQQRPNLHHC
ncbi:hypothetical protein BCR44DRAFT_1114579 [Catenaria anguillulae PL171]|uniref:Uncharacterized protein n=1 Tax=Catenaria anguillulae PL171 TaxID=765915 RepID=A0A1Y2HLX3_9FUNG|nr:hypothetical protein BCR44DRAFT_1114579 [Catenaria anguillulae PL171]